MQYDFRLAYAIVDDNTLLYKVLMAFLIFGTVLALYQTDKKRL